MTTIGWADKNGAGGGVGSGTAASPRQPAEQPVPATSIGSGSAGAKTTWSTARKQPARNPQGTQGTPDVRDPAQSAPPYPSIDKAFDELFAALAEKAKVDAGGKTEAQVAVNRARDNVHREIRQAMETGCRPGPFPPGCGSADLRKRGESIAAAYVGKRGESEVRDVIEAQQVGRVAEAVRPIGEAIKDPTTNLNAAQIQEFKDILADAADFVTNSRRVEWPGEARFEQFLRLSRLLANIKDAGGNFHPGVFARVVIHCAAAMQISSPADLDALNHITGPYNNPQVNDWIKARRQDIVAQH
jgi:hypothetical protein